MDTANIISILSLFFAVSSFAVSVYLGFRDKAKSADIQKLQEENQLRQDFAERWFCTPILSYLASFQGCILSVVEAMHITDAESRQQSFTTIFHEKFSTIYDDMDTFCDSRGDDIFIKIKEHLSDFMDNFIECFEEARINVDHTNITSNRRALLLTLNNFGTSVNASLLSELKAIKKD